MDKKRVALTKQQFDSAVHNHGEAKVEYWFARELMPLLGYERWENFDKAISRAMESCETSGIEVIDHFREVTKNGFSGQWFQAIRKRLYAYPLRLLPNCSEW